MITIPEIGYTSRRCAELLNVGVREACRLLKAHGYVNRQGRWYRSDTPHKSMDKWNSKAARSGE